MMYWHVTRKGESRKEENIRHYQTIKGLYDFILRNPYMFKNRDLIVWCHHEPVAKLTFEEVEERKSKKLRNYKEEKFVLNLNNLEVEVNGQD